MSLDIEFSSLQADIFEGRKDISVFLVKGRFYYLADDKENFCIDVRPEYRSYVERGVLQEELYDAALFQFRGGVPVLNCETFEVYVKNNNLALLSVEWMRGFFRHSLPAGYFSQLYRKLRILRTSPGYAKIA
ncbi:hypothetical protein [Pseudomonas sp. RIT-To-2]|uniref:hypothetical protein n=1 Tax=Pseudomonas sp. RIT-To-2 TaxID=3462541 RepID=UPI002412FBA4